MSFRDALLSPPAALELWVILVYVAVILAAARVMEALARIHVARARQYSDRGFTYDEDFDSYSCPVGERLTLQAVDASNRFAEYRARASSCGGCPLKKQCTPHEDGRAIFRSLADWAETDIGSFHRGLSLLMFGVGTLLCANRLWWRRGEPGTGLLMLALLTSVSFFVFEIGRWKLIRPPRGAPGIHP